MPTEPEIIQRCRNNDRKAQEELFRLYGTTMMGVCLRYAHTRDEARDILHEGFIKVFTAFDSYKGQSALKTWLTSIFINTAISYTRKHFSRTLYIEENLLPESAENTDENDRSLQDFLLDNVTQQEVLAMVQELPDKYRVAINMYCIDGFSHAEISDTLGISEGTSKSHLSRARKMLSALFLKKN